MASKAFNEDEKMDADAKLNRALLFSTDEQNFLGLLSAERLSEEDIINAATAGACTYSYNEKNFDELFLRLYEKLAGRKYGGSILPFGAITSRIMIFKTSFEDVIDSFKQYPEKIDIGHIACLCAIAFSTDVDDFVGLYKQAIDQLRTNKS